MKARQDKIGQTKVLIQVMDDEPMMVGKEGEERQTRTTGVPDKIASAWSQVLDTTKQMASDFGHQFDALDIPARPKSVEIGFQVGISAKFGAVWFLASADANSSMTIKMIWERENAD